MLNIFGVREIMVDVVMSMILEHECMGGVGISTVV
jgi:hypothetical protein